MRLPDGMVSRLWRACARVAVWFVAAVARYPESIVRGYRRSGAARRVLWRAIALTIGFALYIGLELLVARAIIADRSILALGAMCILFLIVILAAHPIIGLLALLVVSPIAVGFLSYRNRGVMPDIGFDGILVYTLFVVVIIRALYSRKPIRKLEWPEALLAIYPVYVLANYLLQDRVVSLNATRGLVEFIGFWPAVYFITQAAIRRKEHILWVMKALVFVGLCQGAALIYEQLTGNAYLSILYRTPIPLKYLGWSDVGVGRSVGLFESPVVASVFLPTMMFFALHLAVGTKTRLSKLYYAVTIGVIVIGAYYTYTRNVYTIMALFMIAMPFVASKLRPLCITVVAFVALLAVSVITPRLLSDTQFNKRITNTENLAYRMLFMQTAVNMIRDHFVWGVGYNGYLTMAPQYVSSYRESSASLGKHTGLFHSTFVHNTYLYVLAEEGIVGALIYFGCLIGFLRILMRLRRVAKPEALLGKDFLSIIVVSTVLLFVQFIPYSNHYARYMNITMWVTFSIGVRYGQFMMEELKNNRSVSEREGAAEPPPVLRISGVA